MKKTFEDIINQKWACNHWNCSRYECTFEYGSPNAHDFGQHDVCGFDCPERAKMLISELPQSEKKTAWAFFQKAGYYA